MTKPNKRDMILDAMQALMSDDLASTASVSDIAKKAGIAKGGIYYYFKSKDEILDAVLERSYSQAVEQSWSITQKENLDALTKLKRLFMVCVYPDLTMHQKEMLNYLHLQDNLTLHHKFLALTIKEFTPILNEILLQGIKENTLHCEYPQQTSEIILSMLVFLLDHTLFPYNKEDISAKLHALAFMLEHSMGAPEGSFDFFFEPVDSALALGVPTQA